MKAQNKFAKLAILILTTGSLLLLSTLATAQSDALRAIYVSAANVPTNISGVRTFAEPPKAFHPVTATDLELATYGFPPRPDKQADPDHYALWERVMTAAKIRWNGELKPLPVSGHGMIPAGSSPLQETVQPITSGPKQIKTNNASGVIVSSGQKTFNENSIAEVFAYITVPTVRFPFDTTSCTGQGYVEISSAGIDGFVSNTGNGDGYDPMLEGGVFEQVGCSGDIYYFAVTGWKGNYNVAFDVNPGDVVYTIPFTQGGSNSDVYIGDNTTGTYGTFSVTTSGIIGATANWMVERLCCNGNQPVALGNTSNIAFGGASAANAKDERFFYPGSQASSTEVLSMTDDAGDQTIESVTQGSAGYEGRTGLWFSTENCAYSGGCTP